MNKQGDNKWVDVLLSLFGTSLLFHVQFCFFVTCIHISQEAGQMVWYSHLFRIFHSLLWSTQSKVLAQSIKHHHAWLEQCKSKLQWDITSHQSEWSSSKSLQTINAGEGFHCRSVGKESACNAGDPGSIPGLGRSLEKEMATYSSTLAWRIPWTEGPGRLQSMESWKVGQNCVTFTSFYTTCLIPTRNLWDNHACSHFAGQEKPVWRLGIHVTHRPSE